MPRLWRYVELNPSDWSAVSDGLFVPAPDVNIPNGERPVPTVEGPVRHFGDTHKLYKSEAPANTVGQQPYSWMLKPTGVTASDTFLTANVRGTPELPIATPASPGWFLDGAIGR